MQSLDRLIMNELEAMDAFDEGFDESYEDEFDDFLDDAIDEVLDKASPVRLTRQLPRQLGTPRQSLQRSIASRRTALPPQARRQLATSSSPQTGGFRSALFQGDPDLLAVLQGRLRLGRPGDPQYPAPIKSQGTGVIKVQQALVQLGYPTGVDGRYGNQTYNTVLNYKRRYGILTDTGYLDGIVGPKTIRHMDNALAPTPPCCPSPPTNNRDFCIWLQQALNQNLNLNLPVNGIFDASTQSALRRFQQRRGLTPSGTIDPSTLKAFSAGGTPTPPCNLCGLTSDQQLINNALSASQTSLANAIAALKSLETGIISGLFVPELHRRTLDAVKDRLKVTPTHNQFLITIQEAQKLMSKNLKCQSQYSHLVRRDEPFCQKHGETWAWSFINNPQGGIHLCRSWFNTCMECQRDVITHEFFHLVGLKDMVDPTGREPNTKRDRMVLTPSESLRDANEMAQLVSHITTGLTDACHKFNLDPTKPCTRVISP
ncbi:MAG: hypothetical protein Kow00121_54430 [Elainellaceae cyanobacterium]